MGSLSFMLGAILNHHQQSGIIHHGINLLVSTLHNSIITPNSYFN